MNSQTQTDKPKYYDIRADFWQNHWEQADDYETYLANSDADKADRWREKAGDIPAVTAEQVERLTGYGRKLHVLMYTGVWCGDCVRQGPMLKNIVDAADDTVELRCIDRDASEELKDELRILGAMRVPIVVFLTEDFMEVGRFGDRLLTVYRRKAENEVGAACAVPYAREGDNALAAEQSEWVDIFERMLLMTRLSPPLRERHGD
jgi:thiol-disulfide isomerase/thioredoxin